MRAAVLLVIGFCLFLTSSGRTAAQSRVVTEQRVAVIKGDLECRYFSLSPDLKHVAFITEEGNAAVAAERKAVENQLTQELKHKLRDPRGMAAALVKDRNVAVVDGVEIGPFKTVVPPILFSSDGNHVVFKARENSGKQAEFAVLDGNLQSKYWEVSGLKFSPIGSQITYRATQLNATSQQRRYCAVLDGKEQGWCDQMADFGESLYFSPDGQRFAWVGNRARSDGQQERFVCVDGKVNGPYVDEGVPDSGVYFSSDGKHFVYGFQRPTADGQRTTTFLMLDGKERVVNGSLATGKLIFSPDGNRLAYIAGGKLVVTEGETQQQWDCASESPVRFSPDSQRVAFVEKTYNGYRVMVDGVAGPRYSMIGGAPIFSPNSRHVAYVARIENRTNRTFQCFAVVDGVQQKPPLKQSFEDRDILFSADGEHFAYLSESNGRACAVVDGKPGTSFAGSAVENSLVINADGTRMAWVLNSSTRPGQVPGTHAVIFDGRMQTSYGIIEPRSLRLSPDGRHYAYVVIAPKKVGEFGEFAVVDGIKSKTYQTLLPSRADYSDAPRSNLVVFDGNNLIRYAAQTKTEILIVEEKMP